MDKGIVLIIGLSVLSGFLAAEVVCMLIDGQNYPAAIAAGAAALLLIFVRSMALRW